MYVQKLDYKSRISTELLDMVISEGIETGSDVLQTASQIAEDTINTLAGVKYDLTGEFIKTGLSRNHIIVKWAKALATYEIMQRVDDDDVPKKVIKNYEDALDDLEKVSKGLMPLNLPPRQQGDPIDPDNPIQGKYFRRIGSQAKRTHAV